MPSEHAHLAIGSALVSLSNRSVGSDDGDVWELIECFWSPGIAGRVPPYYEFTFRTAADGRRRIGKHAQHESLLNDNELRDVLNCSQAPTPRVAKNSPESTTKKPAAATDWKSLASRLATTASDQQAELTAQRGEILTRLEEVRARLRLLRENDGTRSDI
jgi:hypothetical protein